MARIIKDLYQMTQVQNWLHTVVTFAASGDNTIISNQHAASVRYCVENV